MTKAARHMTPEELADRVGCKPCTLAMWRVKGTGPRFIKFGSSQQARVRYPVAEVEAWESASTHENTGTFPAIRHPSDTQDN